jgi:hypothetical protein
MKQIKKALFGARDLTKFIIFSFAMTIIYTVIAIVFQAVTGETLSDTLTTCYFSLWGGEVLSCALIKVFKLKKEGNTYEGETFE